MGKKEKKSKSSKKKKSKALVEDITKPSKSIKKDKSKKKKKKSKAVEEPVVVALAPEEVKPKELSKKELKAQKKALKKAEKEKKKKAKEEAKKKKKKKKKEPTPEPVEESDSDSSDDEAESQKKKPEPTNDSDSSEDEKEPPKKITIAVEADSSGDESESETAQKKSDNSSDESSAEDAAPEKKAEPAPKKAGESDDSSDSDDKSTKAKERKAKKAADDSSSDASSSEDEPKPSKAGESDSSSDSDSEANNKPPATPGNENKRKNNFGDGSSPKRGRPEGQSKYGATNTSMKGTTPKVFVGNLSYDIDDEKVKEFFKDIGELTDIFWLTDRESGDFKGCGFITFESNEKADQAVEQKAGKELAGRPLKIDWAEQRGGGKKKGGRVPDWVNNPLSARPDNCYSVFLGNLDFNITEDDVKKHFKDCGELKSIRWMQKDGEFKGAGFAEFETTEAVDKAVKLCGKEIIGRAARVDYAKPRAPRN